MPFFRRAAGVARGRNRRIVLSCVRFVLSSK